MFHFEDNLLLIGIIISFDTKCEEDLKDYVHSISVMGADAGLFKKEGWQMSHMGTVLN